MKCITCLSKGIDRETDYVYDGLSLCIEHIVERSKEYDNIQTKYGRKLKDGL